MRLTGRLRPDSANVDSESWPPPEDPAEFEWLCLDLFKELWGDPGARRGARSGQPKAGVDIFGKASNQLFGVQCKREDGLLWTRVTARDLQREVENALGFRPRLDTFILALAGPGNVIVEERAREITEEHRALGLFEVEVWSWVEIWYEISNRQELLRRILPIYWPRTSRLEAGALPESASGALALWREKLEFLLEQRAIAADIEQRFRLMKQIEEAERKIRDFDG